MQKSNHLKTYRGLLIALLLLTTISQTVLADQRWQAISQPYFQEVRSKSESLTGPVNAIAQDADGFIWISSGYELLRWDAHQFTSARLEADEVPIAPDVLCIKADPEGNIWVGTVKGLYKLDHKNLLLKRIKLPALSNMEIKTLNFDFNGKSKRILISGDRELAEWQVDSNQVQLHALPNIANNRVHDVLIDGQDQLWVGTTHGLFYKSLGDTNAKAFTELTQLPNSPRISKLFSDHAKRLWIGTAKDGVYRLEQNGTIQKIELPDFTKIQPWIYAIQEPKPNQIWLGTLGRGIIAIDSNTLRARHIQHNPLQKSSLLDDNIWCLFRDRRGLIWIGNAQGMNLYQPEQSVLTHVPGGPGTVANLSDPEIRSILAMPNDQLWLGTGSRGIEIFNPTEHIRHLDAKQLVGDVLIPEDPIEAMSVNDNDSVVTGSNFNTLRIRNDGSSANTFSLQDRASEQFSATFAHFQLHLWVGGPDGLWRKGNAGEKDINVLATSKGERRIASLMADENTLWIGSWSGLMKLSVDARAVNGIRISTQTDRLLEQQFITSLAKDGKGRIWVGTSRAGLLFNTPEGIAKQSPWHRLGKDDGLPNNTISTLLTDDTGNIWASTPQGISRIDAQTLNIDTISQNQGASAAPYQRASGAKNAAGELFFGGANGLTVIKANQWQAFTFKAPLAISRIVAGNNEALSLIATNAATTTKVMLAIHPDIKNWTVEFTALDYLAPERVRYRYRLEGYDKQWIETDAGHRTASYTKLPPGDYTLQAEYSLDGQHWQSGTFALPVRVKPSWNETLWFRSLIVLVALGLIALGWFWRTRIFHERQIELQRLVDDRTLALNQAYKQLQSKSEEIEEASLTDSLTGLHNRRFIFQTIESDCALVLRRHEGQLKQPITDFYNADLIFLLIDLDYFKTVNDKYGHAAGDNVLIEMHSRLKSVFRDADYLIRWGGEEFLVIARNSSRQEAADLAERLRIAVAEKPFQLGNAISQAMTCSIGFAAFPFIPRQPSALNWSDTLALADTAMYQAKRAGRNRWIGFECKPEAQIGEEKIQRLRSNPESVLHLDEVKAYTYTFE